MSVANHQGVAPRHPSDPGLTVVRVIARLNIGGPARHAVILNRGLDAVGCRTLLVHGNPEREEGSLGDLVAASGIRDLRIPELGRRIRPWSDLVALWRVFRVMLRERPDVVHTHTAKAGVLGRLAGVAYNVTHPRDRRSLLVHTFHGHVFSGYFGALGSLAVRWTERALARVTDVIVTISPAQRDEIVRRYRVADEKKVVVIPLGLELDELGKGADRVAARASLGFAAGDFVLGYVGRLVPIKDLATLLRAFQEVSRSVPEAKLAIVGDGELRGALEHLAEELDVSARVRFCGWRRDLPAVYASFDLVALSSRNEGTPVALIEAMAAGLPVVATRVGGVPDVVQPGVTGLLAPPGDSRALASAIIELAQDASRRALMGAAARAWARARYQSDRLVSDVHRLYSDELARRRDSGPRHVPAS